MSQPDPVEQGEEPVMEDIQKVADAAIPVARLLYQQLRYPVWQGGGASRETEEVGNELRPGV